jgi:two-component system nitrogen regulation response regulator GlnG
VYTIWLPPLRERLDDLPLLVDHFISLYSREVSRRVRSASPEAIRLLQGYSWPGNGRELQSAIKNALVNATDEVITPECLPDYIQQGVTLTHQIAASVADDEFNVVALVRRLLADDAADIYHQVQLALDGVVLDEVMRHVKGNQVEAARRLGISRTTLRAKLHALGRLSGQIQATESH